MVIPLILMTALFIFVPSLISSVGFLMILSGAVTIGHAYLNFRKEGKENKA